MRRWRRALVGVALMLVMGAPWSAPVEAQAAATLGILDPAMDDLARLEALGLLPRGWTAQRPFSVARVAWMLQDARGWLARSDLPAESQADAGVLLDRLEARFTGGQRASAWVEAEVGGGRGAGRGIPGNGLGEVDAGVLPLWAGRGGRTYGDRGSLGGTVGGAFALGPKAAAGVSVRGVGARWSGEEVGRSAPLQLERAYLRAVVGDLALEVGRDAATWGAGSLLLSENAPTLDMVRLGTDRPVLVALFGQVELEGFAADLGGDPGFEHTRLFGMRGQARPAPGVRLGLSMLERRGGRRGEGGSPDEDASDKIFGADVRILPPGGRGAALHGEAAVTYLEGDRLLESLGWGAGYRAALILPRLGRSQRHAVQVEASTLGPYLYRHHVFSTGSALEGFLLGSPLGPDGQGLSLGYRYHGPGAAWVLSVAAAAERRRADEYADAPGSPPRLVKVIDRPDEGRLRVQAGMKVPIPGGGGGVDLTAGIEQVTGVGFVADARATNWALLLRVWRVLR